MQKLNVLAYRQALRTARHSLDNLRRLADMTPPIKSTMDLQISEVGIPIRKDIHILSDQHNATAREFVGAEWITPADVHSDKVVLYFHGGGYIMSSAASHRNLTTALATQLNLPVLCKALYVYKDQTTSTLFQHWTIG